jgi:LysR family transcriptional regulator, mexEF-oprN operon transcriptional activator
MSNIIENDFRGVDLNLLLVFRALLQERGVTRAAQRLFLGQPAVSGALKRLRNMFGDELFVRTPRGMEPTPRALELSRSIEPLLLTLHQALTQPPRFDPATAQRTFRLGLSDALEAALMPELMRLLGERAPGVRLITRNADTPRAPGMVDAGEIELAVGAHRSCTAWQRLRPLFGWRFVCVYNPKLVKARGSKLTLDEFLRHRHVLTSFNASLRGYIDEQLEVLGRAREVVFSSPGFATSPFIVERSAAITTVPDYIAALWCEVLGLKMSPLPFAVPEYQMSLLWAAANDQDPGLQWLVELMTAAFGKG